MGQRMMVMACALALIFSLGFAETATMAAGEEPTVDLNSSDAIKTALEQQVGKRVRVKLESGQDLEGKVAKDRFPCRLACGIDGDRIFRCHGEGG